MVVSRFLASRMVTSRLLPSVLLPSILLYSHPLSSRLLGRPVLASPLLARPVSSFTTTTAGSVTVPNIRPTTRPPSTSASAAMSREPSASSSVSASGKRMRSPARPRRRRSRWHSHDTHDGGVHHRESHLWGLTRALQELKAELSHIFLPFVFFFSCPSFLRIRRYGMGFCAYLREHWTGVWILDAMVSTKENDFFTDKVMPNDARFLFSHLVCFQGVMDTRGHLLFCPPPPQQSDMTLTPFCPFLSLLFICLSSLIKGDGQSSWSILALSFLYLSGINKYSPHS
jgi:hypothetical protein